MKISTKGRYALRVMIDLAESEGAYIPMKKVAKRQDISLKYIEKIIPVLVRNNLIDTAQGRNGGYRLSRRAEEYTVYEILHMAEGSLAPVACLEEEAEPCNRRENCKTIEMWNKFYEITEEYFSNITLKDLI